MRWPGTPRQGPMMARLALEVSKLLLQDCFGSHTQLQNLLIFHCKFKLKFKNVQVKFKLILASRFNIPFTDRLDAYLLCRLHFVVIKWRKTVSNSNTPQIKHVRQHLCGRYLRT